MLAPRNPDHFHNIQRTLLHVIGMAREGCELPSGLSNGLKGNIVWPHPNPRHADVSTLPFRRQFFAATIAAPLSSRWGTNQRLETVFRPAAYRNRLWFLTVSVFVRPRVMPCFRASSALTYLFVLSVLQSFSTVRHRPPGVSLRRGTSTDCDGKL